MATIKFNEQQLKAINLLNKNITVSASAGSGKTAVLVERICKRVLEDQIDINQILAITFTDNASKEMKKRLAQKFSDLLSSTSDNDLKNRLERQIVLLETASISTSHSFCLNIIKEFYPVIGLTSEIISNIFDDTTTNLFKQKALDQVFDNYYAQKDQEFLSLLDILQSKPFDEVTLKKSILNITETALNYGEYQNWLNISLNTFEVENIQSFEDLNNSAAYLDFFLNILDVIKKLLIKLVASLTNNSSPLKGKDNKILELNNKIEIIDEIIFNSCNYSNLVLALNNYFSIKFSLTTTSLDYVEEVRIAQLIKSYEKIISVLIYDEKTILNDTKQISLWIKKICEIVSQYICTYNQIKIENKGLDFTDMEQYALKILKIDKVASILKERYTDILIDEFQDTNNLQDQLILQISNLNNVFRVGDIKQSIYGFRNAKPNLFYDYVNKKDENFETIFLSNNYRSSNTIVSFVNNLFQNLMNIDGFIKIFNQDDYAIPLSKKENEPKVITALFTLNKEDKLELEDDVEVSVEYIIKEIQRLRNEFNYDYKDFVILVRSRSKNKIIKQVFDKFNIPIFVDVKTGFYNSIEVQLVLSYLKLLQDPYDDISLIAILRSLFYQITDNELAQIAIETKNKNLSYWDYLKQSKYHYICDELEKIKNNYYHGDIYQLIAQILNINDFFSTKTNEKMITNLNLLLEKAIQADNNQVSVSDFIYLLKDSEGENDNSIEATNLSEDDDVVRVVTIHASKGCQYKNVFVLAPANTNLSENKDFVLINSDLGISMDYCDPNFIKRKTIFNALIKQKIKNSTFEEEIRMLYVALTRPKERLYIIGSTTPSKKEKWENLQLDYATICSNIGYLGWIYILYYNNILDKNYFEMQINPEYNAKKVEIVSKEKQSIINPIIKDERIYSLTATKEKATLLNKTLSFDQSATEYGTKIHEMLEQIDYQNPHSSNIKIKRYLEHEFTKSFNIYKISKEYSFYYKNETGQLVHGFIDLLLEDDQQIIIIDFKTDINITERKLINRYQDQLIFYKNVLRFKNKNISSYLYSFYLDKFIQIQD